MSTAELEMKKARLARKILNERDENIISFLGENLRKMKRTAIDIGCQTCTYRFLITIIICDFYED